MRRSFPAASGSSLLWQVIESGAAPSPRPRFKGRSHGGYGLRHGNLGCRGSGVAGARGHKRAPNVGQTNSRIRSPCEVPIRWPFTRGRRSRDLPQVRPEGGGREGTEVCGGSRGGWESMSRRKSGLDTSEGTGHRPNRGSRRSDSNPMSLFLIRPSPVAQLEPPAQLSSIDKIQLRHQRSWVLAELAD